MTILRYSRQLLLSVSLLLVSAQTLAAADSASVAEPSAEQPAPKARPIVVITVEGDVEPAMAAYIGRAVRGALADPDALVVLEMDTFGGRVDAAFQIVDTLLQFPGDRVVAYVRTKAISAGALIALACGSLYMRPGTTIGDCAPIMVSNDGPKMLGEKFQSPLRAKFRALAKRNGFPEALAEAMVSEGAIVFRIETAEGVTYIDSVDYGDMDEAARKAIIKKTTVVKRDHLLTMDDVEAEELGFSSGSVESVEELAEMLGGSRETLTRLEQTWSESFVRFITKISPILMLIGIAGIYIESRTPGIGFPGIIGGICLLLVFGSQYMVGLAGYTELLLLSVGIILLLVDIFVIPGFGLPGFAGIGFVVAALLLSLQDFVIPAPEMPWQGKLLADNLKMLGLSMAGAVALVVLFFIYVFPRVSKVVSGPRLDTTLQSAHVDSDSTAAVVAVGDQGIVTKSLRPSGTARFGGKDIDVLTEGDFVDPGEKVTVSAIRANTVFVEKAGGVNA